MLQGHVKLGYKVAVAAYSRDGTEQGYWLWTCLTFMTSRLILVLEPMPTFRPGESSALASLWTLGHSPHSSSSLASSVAAMSLRVTEQSLCQLSSTWDLGCLVLIHVFSVVTWVLVILCHFYWLCYVRKLHGGVVSVQLIARKHRDSHILSSNHKILQCFDCTKFIHDFCLPSMAS